VHRAEPSEDGRLLIVTDPIEGESLAGRLLRLGPLHETVIVRLMTAIARGLDQAHAMGVVHGALDAGAVLVGEDGDAMLLGLAVDAAVRSPESMSAGSTGEDVRAFAAILLHALNGEPPARSANVDDIAAWTTRSEEADDPPLRRGIRRAALRGLEHDSDRRPRTCGELMAGIDAAVGAIAAGSSGPSADSSGVGTDGEKRYQTPLDLLELESELAEIVPRKSRLRLPEHDAIRSRWEKGEHFLSSGGVYKQLQHWEPAGKALGQSAGEFRAAAKTVADK
jgi:serine/threonine protein kinase